MAHRNPRIRHIHSSSRYDRSVKSLLKAIWWYITWADLITLTEMDDDARGGALGRVPGFLRVQIQREGGRDECAALVRKRKFRVTHIRPVLLSNTGLPSRGGQEVWCLEFILTHKRTGLTCKVWVIHWPNDAKIAPKGQGHAPSMIHASGRQLISTLYRDSDTDNVLATGDWNWRWEDLGVRIIIRRQFGQGVNTTWEENRPTKDGTFMNNLIDWSVTDMAILKARLMRDDDSSDHQPFRETLVIGPSTRA